LLSADASVYLATYFRKRRDELLRQRSINRKTVSRNIINFEEAEKVVGYLNMFQPDCDFISGVANAHAEAVQKAYELDGQPMTQRVIDQEIMLEVEKILMQSIGGVISREKGRMELLRMRTRRVDSGVSAKLRSLTRHLTKMVKVTQQQIRNDVTLHMLEMKKQNAIAQKTEPPVTDDYRFSKHALDEARKSVAEDNAKPHPMVGAAVVKNGKILAVAHRGEAPGNHAEFTALEGKLSDSSIAGATVYTTLEPCTTRSHPKVPCADRLVERRVARVVIGMLDPDERITGRGVQRLRDGDIRIDFFPHDLMKEVEELNREFTRYCKQQVHKPKELLLEVYNFDGTDGPIQVRGRMHSVQGPKMDLNGLVTIVNPSQIPTKIRPVRLTVDGEDFAIDSFFFREKGKRERLHKISVLGNDKGHYELHFMFPDDKFSEMKQGELLLAQDSSDEPIVVALSFS
jgi:pyrimidine deaminase RibD-like protein